MKIIGSGKIDDFKKLLLEDGVMRALNVKPGDSVLFYRKQNDSGVSMFKAEGAQLSDEGDAPFTNHMREAPGKLRMLLLASSIMMILTMYLIATNFSHFEGLTFYVLVIFWILALAGIVASIFVSENMDRPSDSQTLVTVGGPYSKNRLNGLSKLTDDGYVVSGDLYVNCLFGANPDSVEAFVEYADGLTDKILAKCTKSVPGYSVYRLRFKRDEMAAGVITITTNYVYLGKSISVDSKYDMEINEKGDGFVLHEGDVTASIAFDENLNDQEFDEALFDPNDDTRAF